MPFFLTSQALFSAFCVCVFRLKESETNPVAIAALSEGVFAQLKALESIIHVCLSCLCHPPHRAVLMYSVEQWVIALYGFYVSLCVIIKISVALSFLRIINSKGQRLIVIVSTIISSIYFTAFCFIAVFECGNPANYLLKQAEGQCLDPKVIVYMSYGGAAISIATDWMFVLIPISLVWRSHMPRATKITAGFLLSLGALSSICSMIRIQYIPGLTPGRQFLHNSVVIGTWSCVENGLGIVAISLSTLRPLLMNRMEASPGYQSNPSTSAKKTNTANTANVIPHASSGRVFQHHLDSLYRISDDDLSGTTTTVSGQESKSFGMDELKEGTTYAVKELKYKKGRKDGNTASMIHKNESEQNLVPDGVTKTTEVMIREDMV